MSLTAAEIMDEAALLLNDSNKVTFTYTVLAPWLKRAVNEYSDELAVNNIKLLNKASVVIPTVAGTTTVPMPSDALLPIMLEERLAGSANSFSPMAPVDGLNTSITPEQSFGVWAFQGTLLNSVPVIDVPNANTAREVRITYIRYLPYSTIDGSTDFSTSLTINSKRFLGSKVAELIARFVLKDAKRGDELKGESAQAKYRIIQIWVKFNQKNPVRRSRYRGATPSISPDSFPGVGGAGGVDLTNVAFVNLANIFSLLQTFQAGFTANALSTFLAGFSSSVLSTFLAGALHSGTNPFIRFNETDGGVNLKNWDISVDAQTLTVRSLSDAFAVLLNLLSINRSGDLFVTRDMVATRDLYEKGRVGAVGSKTVFTPNFTNVTLGNGSAQGLYSEIGNISIIEAVLVFGTTTAVTGQIGLNSLPVTNRGTAAAYITGNLGMFDSSAGQFYGGIALTGGTTSSVFYGYGTPLVVINAAAPFVWATSDQLFYRQVSMES